jgi:hypothetical protein
MPNAVYYLLRLGYASVKALFESRDTSAADNKPFAAPLYFTAKESRWLGETLGNESIPQTTLSYY